MEEPVQALLHGNSKELCGAALRQVLAEDINIHRLQALIAEINAKNRENGTGVNWTKYINVTDVGPSH